MHLRDEDVVQIIGTCGQRRLAGTENDQARHRRRRNRGHRVEESSTRPMCCPSSSTASCSNEDLRMTDRYLDLRRERMNRNIRTRHAITNAARNYLDAARLRGSGDARSFQSDARRRARLPRARPPEPRQVFTRCRRPRSSTSSCMMVAGLERSSRSPVASAMKDLRADRQPEFTADRHRGQLHRAATTSSRWSKACSPRMFKAGRASTFPTDHFPRMTYQEAMDRYGSPTSRTRAIGMEIIDLRDVFAQHGLQDLPAACLDGGGVVRAINARASPASPPAR